MRDNQTEDLFIIEMGGWTERNLQVYEIGGCGIKFNLFCEFIRNNNIEYEFYDLDFPYVYVTFKYDSQLQMVKDHYGSYFEINKNDEDEEYCSECGRAH